MTVTNYKWLAKGEKKKKKLSILLLKDILYYTY